MNDKVNIRKVDPVILGCYIFLLIFGWMNIYASSTQDTGFSAFDPSAKYAMQLIWIGSAILIDIMVLRFIPKSFYNVFSLAIYLFTLALLFITIFIGKEVNGSKSWLVIGSFRIQPAEFSKIAVALMLSTIMEKYTFSFKSRLDVLKVLTVLALPAGCILLEKETGLILVYAAFFLVFYREGMSGWVLMSGLLAILFFILTLILSPFAAIVIWTGLVFIYAAFTSRRFWLTLGIGAAATALLANAFLLERIDALKPYLEIAEPEILTAAVLIPVALGIIIYSFIAKTEARLRRMAAAFILGVGFIISCDFAFNTVLQDHQRLRIEELLGMKDDPMGAGYNVRQSMIAIGSGGLTGKGFTQGTQTRFDFVPEQSTDFIFCTVGEEWGFIGSLAVIICYAMLIMRLYNSAEKQKDRFNRIFGYCVASCILLHVVINLGMTIGLMPVIGIPLPMLSYGGSSLWVFSILIFVYLRLDMESKW